MWWWSSYGWWWWWWGMLILLFLLPLGYGWGMRGWGPWYRRRPVRREFLPPDGTDPFVTERGGGWGWLGAFLWVVLVVLVVWLIAVWGWGGTGMQARGAS